MRIKGELILTGRAPGWQWTIVNRHGDDAPRAVTLNGETDPGIRFHNFLRDRVRRVALLRQKKRPKTPYGVNTIDDALKHYLSLLSNFVQYGIRHRFLHCLVLRTMKRCLCWFRHPGQRISLDVCVVVGDSLLDIG